MRFAECYCNVNVTNVNVRYVKPQVNVTLICVLGELSNVIDWTAIEKEYYLFHSPQITMCTEMLSIQWK